MNGEVIIKEYKLSSTNPLFSVYACGGCGINIIKKISNISMNKYFADTSVSNLKSLNNDNVFLIEDMDGAGKHRGTTYELGKDLIGDILTKFKPHDSLNIVISSLSGGSGSVIAPLIVGELLEKGKNVIVIGVSSTHSGIELRNSIKTLQSYRGVSDATDKSFAMLHVENDSRNKADSNVAVFLGLMATITDKGKTEEFDTSDLANFINFDRVTENSPNVGLINLTNNIEISVGKNVDIVSTIFITSDHEETLVSMKPEYLATCIVPNFDQGKSVRINNTLGTLVDLLQCFDQELQRLTDTKTLNKVKDVKVKGNEKGMVI